MSVRIKLSDLSEEQKKAIRKHLLFQPKQSYFRKNNWWSDNQKEPIQFYYIDKPKGEIVLPYTFANILMGKHINSERQYPPGKYDFLGTLMESKDQPNIVREAWEQLQEYGTTLLHVPPSRGKTIMSAYLGSLLGGLVIVVMNRKTIQKGWVNTFTEFTNAGVWVFDNKNHIPEKCNVIIVMEGKFHKIPPEILRMVSVFILDEAHMFCTVSQVALLLSLQPKYIIACTATLERSDGMHKMVESLIGTHGVYREPEKEFIVYGLFTGIKKETEKTKNGTTNWAKLVNDLAMDPKRNAIILDLVENNPEFKILILSWNKSHINLLTNIFMNRGISVDYLSGTKSSFKDSRVLIGTISKIGTGFDPKMASEGDFTRQFNMMIICGSTKSVPLLKQIIGRGFRADFPIIFDFVDDNRITKNHWRIRKKEYQLMNCEIKTIHMKKDQEKHEKEKVNNIHNNRLKKLQNKLKHN